MIKNQFLSVCLKNKCYIKLSMSTLEFVDHKYKRTQITYDTHNFLLSNLDTSQVNTYPITFPKLKPPNNYYYPYEQFNHNLWIDNNDFLSNENSVNGDDLIITLLEDISYIINENQIDNNELDNDFKQYLKFISEAIQVIMNYMFEENRWISDPISNFIWIYMISACCYEPRAVKYLMKSPFFIDSLITKKDKYGYSPLFFAIRNNKFDISLFDNYITLDTMKEIYFNENVLINYAIKNPITMNYIMNKINISEIDYTASKYNPLMLACVFEESIIEDILNKNTYANNMLLKKGDESMTCLMYSLLNTPGKFKLLLESQYCTQDIVNTTHINYGNILLMAIKYQPDLALVILDSTYNNQDLLFGAIRYKSGVITNILIEACKNKQLFEKIITNQYFTLDILTMFTDVNLLIELVHIDNEIIKILLEHNCINEEHLTICDSNGLNLLLYSVIFNPQVFTILLHSEIWNDDFMTTITYKNTKKNLIMLLIETLHSSDNLIDNLYNQGYITDLILNHYDIDEFNTFGYLCLYRPNIALDILNNSSYDIKQFLTNDVLKKISYHSPNIFDKIIKKETEINKYINHEFFISSTDLYNNNFLLETSLYDLTLTRKLIENNLVNEISFHQINTNGDNLLTLLLKNKYSNELLLTLQIIINHPLMNEAMLKHQNNAYESPFLLSCTLNHQCVNLIINSKHFVAENFIVKTHNATNCFVYACQSDDINLIKTICEHPLFLQDDSMFKGYDMMSIPHIYYAMVNHLDIAKFVLNHQYCNNTILYDSYKLILLNKKFNCDLLDIILDLNICSPELLLLKDQLDRNCLTLAVKNQNINTIKKILESTHFTEELLFNRDYSGKSVLYYINDYEILDSILHFSKFNPMIFTLRNNNQSNVLNYYATEKKYNLLNIIINSKKCPIEALKCDTELECSIILKLFTLDEQLVENILSLPDISSEDLLCTDPNGNTCLHYMANNYIDRMNLMITSDTKEYLSQLLNKLKKYINSEKCSKELFEKKNSLGKTFLLLNPHLTSIVLKSKYCTTQLIRTIDNTNNSLISTLCFSTLYRDYLKELLDSQFISTDILIENTDNCQYNLINRLCINNDTYILQIIFDSSLCNNDIINYIDEKGYTPLAYAIMFLQPNTISLILNNNKLDLSRSFEQLYDDNKNLLMITALTTDEIFKLIIQSKYVTKEMFLQTDKYGHNVVTYSLNKNLEMVKSIVESEYWTDDLKFSRDIDNDNIMLFPYNNPKIVKYLLSSESCTIEMVKMINNLNKNCSHYYAKNNHESMFNLLDSKLCSDKILQQQDYLGNTCLHEAFQYNIISAKYILESTYDIKNLLMIQNKNKKNPIMIGLKYNQNLQLKSIIKFINSKEIIFQQDNKGNNLIFYAVRYNLKLLRILLKSKYCDYDTLNIRNNKNMTCHMYACKHNGHAMELLLAHKDCHNNMLYSSHMDYGSCLTLAARYQPIALQFLLQWDKLSWKVIHTSYNKEDFLKIACTYNSESVKHALESSIDLSEFINTKESPFILACRYQPDAVKYLLESKYGSKSMITQKINDRMAIFEAYDLQPKALLNIIQSQFGGDDLFQLEDEKGYRLKYNITHIFPDIPVKDLHKINLVHYDNIPTKENEKACDICYTFKPIVILIPCHHMCCIGCAFKLEQCHLCRGTISERKVIYE